MHQSVDLHQLAALGDEDVGLHRRCRLAGLLPGEDASVEVIHRAAVGYQLFSGLEATASAAAVDGNLSFDVFNAFGEVVSLHIDILRSCEVPFGIFLGGAHIDEPHLLLSHNLGKFLYADGLHRLVVFSVSAAAEEGCKHCHHKYTFHWEFVNSLM